MLSDPIGLETSDVLNYHDIDLSPGRITLRRAFFMPSYRTGKCGVSAANHVLASP